MTITQQFLLLAIIPVTFLGMAIYTWNADVRRRQLFWRWTVTLLLTAVWSSSVLSFFSEQVFVDWFINGWRIAGVYAFSLASIGMMLTTAVYLSSSRRYARTTLVISLVILGSAIALDPKIWGAYLPEFAIAGQNISQLIIWTGIWVVSWLIPVVAAWLLTQQTNSGAPTSLYRNQVNYWLLVLTIFFIGCIFVSLPLISLQQLSLLIILMSMLIGTYTITRNTLPDLLLAARQLMSRLSGTLIIFGVVFGVLFLIVNVMETMPQNLQFLFLIGTAVLFAFLFSWFFRFINDLTRRIFLPSRIRKAKIMADYNNASGNLPNPDQLAKLFLRLLQTNVNADDAWVLLAEDGPGGKLNLRPLAGLGSQPTETVTLEYKSPITQYLRTKNDPLVLYDLNTLEAFEDVTQEELDTLNNWQRILFQSIHAGDTLVAVLAVGPKYSGESYNQKDFAMLTNLAEQIGPLLAQAIHLAGLQRINEYVFSQNRALARKNKLLEELVHLYAQFVQTISPDLRRPFSDINQEIQRYQNRTDNPEQKQFASTLSRQMSELQSPIDHLITMSTRIQKREQFNFDPVQLSDVTQKAIRNLRTMAEARRVEVEFNSATTMTTVIGDEHQLQEAIHHILHNAIKFNKIGGTVFVNIGLDGTHLSCRIADTGVGIPEERIDKIWVGLDTVTANGSGRTAGLGLAIARFVINAHGGSIIAESQYGSGSTFTILLPLIYED